MVADLPFFCKQACSFHWKSWTKWDQILGDQLFVFKEIALTFSSDRIFDQDFFPQTLRVISCRLSTFLSDSDGCRTHPKRDSVCLQKKEDFLDLPTIKKNNCYILRQNFKKWKVENSKCDLIPCNRDHIKFFWRKNKKHWSSRAPIQGFLLCIISNYYFNGR